MVQKPHLPEVPKSRKEEILDSAIELLIHDGYGSLSTDKVANNIGISKGNLTYYFPTKREFTRQMFKRLIDISKSRRAEYKELLDTNCEDAFEKYLQYEFEILSSPRYDAQVWETYAFSAHNSEVRDMVDEILDWYLETLVELLTPLRSDLDHRQRKTLGKIILAMIRGLLIYVGSSRKPNGERGVLIQQTKSLITDLAYHWIPE